MSVEDLMSSGHQHSFQKECKTTLFEVAKVTLAIVFAEAMIRSFGAISINGQLSSLESTWIVVAVIIGLTLLATWIFLSM